MAQQKSMARAVFDRDILGPSWRVVDESGVEVNPGNQNFGHTRKGRAITLRESGSYISTVIDYQYDSDAEVDSKLEKNDCPVMTSTSSSVDIPRTHDDNLVLAHGLIDQLSPENLELAIVFLGVAAGLERADRMKKFR